MLDNVSTEGARVKAALITAAVKDGSYSPATALVPVDESEKLFAQEFYKGRSQSGSTVVEPSKSDLGAVKALVQSLALRKTAGHSADWGHAFGRHVRGRETAGKRIATLSLAVKAYGDEWMESYGAEDQRARAERLRKERLSHEEASQHQYREYLMSELARMKESNTEAFRAWEASIQEQVERVHRSQVLTERAKGVALSSLNSESGRLERFAEFMAERNLVLGFWEWDRRMNPQGYMEVAQ
ncbi:hypothetical protein EON81_01745 [bacterium]|nr:MAG: hypothetical protein EON81_01745 [bacterium]